MLAVLLLRRLPVLLLLKRPLHLGWPDALYLGWFGPVGVSAVFYLTLEAKELGLPETVMGSGDHDRGREHRGSWRDVLGRPTALPAHERDRDGTAGAPGLTFPPCG